jgi:HSP20 family protein
MPINVHQSDADVWIEAALPGVQPEDIDLSCNEGLLTIRAHSEVEEREYFHQELRSIEYLRQVMLPVECRFDSAEASFEHGMLRIRIPKQRPHAPEKIQIQVNRKGGPTTIEAAKGVGYREVAPKAKPRATAKPASKKASAGAAKVRKAAPGSGSAPSR